MLAMVAVALTAACSTPRERIVDSGMPTDTLTCNRAATHVGNAQIPASAPVTVSNGPDELSFPGRAMPEGTTVTFTALDPPLVGVRVTLDPQPDSFKPSRLIIRCQGPPPAGDWKIWRMPDQGDTVPPQALETKPVGNGFETTIIRNSFFIIAN
jgi:hypothetical protein